jgi:hypothetical protein
MTFMHVGPPGIHVGRIVKRRFRVKGRLRTFQGKIVEYYPAERLYAPLPTVKVIGCPVSRQHQHHLSDSTVVFESGNDIHTFPQPKTVYILVVV